MTDKIFWEYLEGLPEQKAAWCEWHRYLADWHRFNTFYTHYLRIEDKRAKRLKCMELCDHGCMRRIIESSPSDIIAVCPLEEFAPVRLSFKDILIYSLRYENFHKGLCISLKILPTEYSVFGSGNTWHLGDYYCASIKLYYTVYLTYRTAALNETISSLCHLCRKPFILMSPTGRGLGMETQQLLAGRNSVLLSMEAELILQPNGSFKSMRSIAECIKSCNPPCPQAGQNTTLPIEAYKYLVYSDL